ncbi:uncharacterized protein METZ01_LOCUS239063, partial [marine metagenome]
MSLDMNTTPTRQQFKAEIDKLYGDGEFTMQQAKDALEAAGQPKSKWSAIYQHVLMKHCLVSRGVFSFSKVGKVLPAAVKAKKTLKSDLDIINDTDVVAQKWDNIAKEAKAKYDKPVVKNKATAKVASSSVSLIPKSDPQYVTGGHFKDIKTILQSKIFYPVFITGLSGNGKTCMIHEVCAKLKRDLVRINITVETDEDDLLGGFRLIDGETVWQDGPIINAMRRGSIALIDEIDLASHKIMCLQPVLEGKPIY